MGEVGVKVGAVAVTVGDAPAAGSVAVGAAGVDGVRRIVGAGGVVGAAGGWNAVFVAVAAGTGGSVDTAACGGGIVAALLVRAASGPRRADSR